MQNYDLLLLLVYGFYRYAKCENFIKDMKEGNLQCHPGLDEAETLEAMILKELSAIREHAGKACMTQLKPSNSALIMALCGSKGTPAILFSVLCQKKSYEKSAIKMNKSHYIFLKNKQILVWKMDYYKKYTNKDV